MDEQDLIQCFNFYLLTYEVESQKFLSIKRFECSHSLIQSIHFLEVSLTSLSLLDIRFNKTVRRCSIVYNYEMTFQLI